MYVNSSACNIFFQIDIENVLLLADAFLNSSNEFGNLIRMFHCWD